MNWFLILSIPLLTTALWLYTIGVARTTFPRIANKNVVLLIAHPDDEAMFFAPTLLGLTEEGNHVKILCLSSGDADGLGEIRKKELAKSGLILGLRSEDDVTVIDSPDFPDSMNTSWASTAISFILKSFCLSPETGSPEIDILITFDSQGVSSHPNHISLHAGARHFLSSPRNEALSTTSQDKNIAFYTLTSLPIYRKYMSILDCLPSITSKVFRGQAERDGNPRWLLFTSGPQEMGKAREAMWGAHKSQMRWFRWGWIWFSRYMAVNDLVLEDIG